MADLPKLDITEAFGLKVRRKGRKVLPPPPRVWVALLGVAHFREAQLESHRAKRVRRRNKRRRIRARNTILRRHAWRSFHEQAKKGGV